MTGDRFYVVGDESGEDSLMVIGWDLKYEPSPYNECGYTIFAGPFATKAEAEAELENM